MGVGGVRKVGDGHWGGHLMGWALGVAWTNLTINFIKQQQQKKNFAIINKSPYGGAWVTRLIKRLTSAQVMISRFVGLSPVSGAVLTAQSLGPASILCFPLCAPPQTYALSLSLSLKLNKHYFFLIQPYACSDTFSWIDGLRIVKSDYII